MAQLFIKCIREVANRRRRKDRRRHVGSWPDSEVAERPDDFPAAHLSLAHPGSYIATTVSLFDQGLAQVLRKLPATITSIRSPGGSISAN